MSLLTSLDGRSLGSTTETLTVPEQRQAAGPYTISFTLRAPETTGEKIKTLLGKMMEASERLPFERREEVYQMVSDWGYQFFQNDQSSSPVDQERLKAAYRICYLHNNLENVMFYYAESDEEKIAWDDLIFALQERLSEVLPENFEAEAFLATYRERLAKQGMLSIFAELNALREKLYSDANRISEQLTEQFEELKAEMERVHQLSKLSYERTIEQVDAATQETADLIEDFKGPMSALKRLEAHLEKQERQMEQSSNALNDVLRKV